MYSSTSPSPDSPDLERYIQTQLNMLKDSRYSLRYSHTQRRLSMDTAEHSRYSTNHPYIEKHRSARLNDGKYSPPSSNTKRYNDEDSTVTSSHSSRYSGTETFAAESSEHPRLEINSSRYPHTERYPPAEVSKIGDYFHSYLGRNGRSSPETFEDSFISSPKYRPANFNTADHLQYPQREQNVTTTMELGIDRNQTYLSHNLRLKPFGREVDEESAFFPAHYARKCMPYAETNSEFDSLSHRGRNLPIELDNEANPSLGLLNTEHNASNLHEELLYNPYSGRYNISTDPDAAIASKKTNSNTNYTPISQQLERRQGIAEFDEADAKACHPMGKRKFCCELCPKKFRRPHPLHMHMVDKHNLNDGKYIPSVHVQKPKVVLKQLMQMKHAAKLEVDKMKLKSKLERMLQELEEPSEPYLPTKKQEKCGLCYKSVRVMHRHMNGMHNPRFRFKCDICCKTFRLESQLKLHKIGKGTNKCLSEEKRRAHLELSKSPEDPAKGRRNSPHAYEDNQPYNYSEGAKREFFSKDLEDRQYSSLHPAIGPNVDGDPIDSSDYPHAEKNTTTEIDSTPMAHPSIELDVAEGEAPTESRISGDPTDVSAKTTAAENSTRLSHSNHTGRYIPIELDAVIASSSSPRPEVQNFVSRPIFEPLKCELCNEKFHRKSYLTHHKKVKHGIYRPQYKISCPFFLCTRKFKKPAHLKSHRASSHANVHSNKALKLVKKK